MNTDPSTWSLAAALVLGTASAGAAVLAPEAERPQAAQALPADAAHAPELALRREHLHKRTSAETAGIVSSSVLVNAREHAQKHAAPTPVDLASPSALEQQRLVLAARLRLSRND